MCSKCENAPGVIGILDEINPEMGYLNMSDTEIMALEKPATRLQYCDCKEGLILRNKAEIRAKLAAKPVPTHAEEST